LQDVAAIKDSILALGAVSPVASTSMTALYNAKNYQTNVQGVNDDYFKIQNWKLQRGRYFSKNELKAGRSVCIIGKTDYEKLFAPSVSPIGKVIRLENFSCTVIGLLSPKGANTLKFFMYCYWITKSKRGKHFW